MENDIDAGVDEPINVRYVEYKLADCLVRSYVKSIIVVNTPERKIEK